MSKTRVNGFSLLEMAIVLLISSILLAGWFRYQQIQLKERPVTTTKQVLATAREALLSYAALTGSLPCPASATSHGQPDTLPSGLCRQPYDGWLPAAFLAIPGLDEDGLLADGWESAPHRIRYAVAVNGFSGFSSCTSAPSNKKAGLWTATANAPNNLKSNFYETSPLIPELCVCSTASCNPSSTWLANGVVAVLYSAGGNAGLPSAGSDEQQNMATDIGADRIFVMHGMSQQTGNEFDDLVTWISAPELYGRLLSAGKL